MKAIYKGMLSGGVCAKVYMDFKDAGSSVEFPHDGEPYHVISIGACFPDWGEVYDGILHEMMELHLCNMELCYQRWYRGGCDSGDVWFHFSHADYSECISRTSQGLLCFVDEAKKVFDNYHNPVVEQDSIKPKIRKDESDDASNTNEGGS